MLRPFRAFILALTAIIAFGALSVHAQELAKRLILQDGSYQLASKWEIKGDRVRYFSAERGEWEELPKALVDWPATDKFEKDRAAGVPPPEAVELDKEVAAEKAADLAKTPLVAPGLRLPEDENGIVLLDTYQGQPQLVELQQDSGAINKNMKKNLLKAAVIPIASARQTVEIPGAHSTIQAHSSLPSVYVNVNQEQTSDASSAQLPEQMQAAQQGDQPWDRFKIVRVQTKQGKRIVGDIKINPMGKTSQKQNLVPTTADRLTGGWVKVTPAEPLASGEYAVVEMLGKEGMNLYVWDFGVNPNAPANTQATNPGPPTGMIPASQLPPGAPDPH